MKRRKIITGVAVGGIVLVVLPVAAYLLLPWWLPAGIVSELVAGHLSRQFDRQVEVGGMTMSWEEGIRFQQVILRRKVGYGQGQMLFLREVTVPFQPGDIWRKKVNQVKVDEGEVFIVVSEAGTVNVFDMPASESEPIHLTIGHLDVWFEDVRDPNVPRGLIELVDVRMAREPDGAMSWRADGHSRRNPALKLATEGQIGQDGRGEGRITFSDIQLVNFNAANQLNRFWRSVQPDKQTAGLTQVSGRVSVALGFGFSDYMPTTLDGTMQVQDVRIRGGEENDLWAQHMTMTTRLRAEKISPGWQIELQKLRLEGPGLNLEVEGHCPWSAAGLGQASAAVPVLEVRPKALAQTLPVLRPYLDAVETDNSEWRLSGQGVLDRKTGIKGQAAIDASAAALHRIHAADKVYRINKAAGQSCRIQLSGRYGFDGEYEGEIHGVAAGATMEATAIHARDPNELTLTGKVTDMKTLLQIVPDAEEWLRTAGVALEGNCAGDLNMNDVKQQRRTALHLRATDLAVTVEGSGNNSDENNHWVNKPAGVAGVVRWEMMQDTTAGGLRWEAMCRLGNMEIEISGEDEDYHLETEDLKPPDPDRAAVQLRCGQLDEATRYMPAITDYLAPDSRKVSLHDLSGAATASVRLEKTTAGWRGDFTGVADDAEFVLTRQDAPAGKARFQWRKTPAMPARLAGAVSFAHEKNDANNLMPLTGLPVHPGRLRLEHGEFEFAETRLEIRGQAWYPGRWRKRNGSLITELRELLEPAELMTVAHMTAHAAGVMADHDKWLALLAADAAGLHLSGTTAFSIDGRWEKQPGSWVGDALVDMRGTGVQAILGTYINPVYINKTAGEPLLLKTRIGSSDEGPLHIDDLNISLPQAVLNGDLVVEGFAVPDNDHSPANPWDKIDFDISFDAGTLEHLSSWFIAPDANRPGLSRFSGPLSFTIGGEMTRRPAWHCRLTRPLEVAADVRSTWQGKPVTLHVLNLEADTGKIEADAIQVTMGGNDLTLSGWIADPVLNCRTMQDPNCRPRGRIDMLSHRLDVVEVTEFIASLAAHFSDPNTVHPPDPNGCSFDDVLAMLRRGSLAGMVQVDRLRFYDVLSGAEIMPDKLLCRLNLEEGKGTVDVYAALNGGVLEEMYLFDFTTPDGYVRHERLARDLNADQAIAPMVESEFPGMEVTGSISQRFEEAASLRCLTAGACDWAGSGVTTCREGLLFGPGGPGWMIRVFPGLELVEYPWKRMTNRFESLGDGRRKNHIVFQGRRYNIYIGGVNTDVKDRQQYQRVIAMMRTELLEDRKRLAEEGNNLDKIWRERLQKRIAGLTALLKMHDRGKKLPMSEADYVVGVLISIERSGRFESAREILRVPVFETHSFVVGRYMIGMKTRNVSLEELGRENPLYRLIVR